MLRPIGITVTAILMCISLFTETVVSLPRDLSTSYSATIELIVVQIIAALFVWFYWTGHNWARWLVQIQSVICLVALLGLTKKWSTSHIGGLVLIYDALLSVFLLWYLNTQRVRGWFALCRETADRPEPGLNL